jgi:hypothetical protein
MRRSLPERHKISQIDILNAVNRHPKKGVEIAFNIAWLRDPGGGPAGRLPARSPMRVSPSTGRYSTRISYPTTCMTFRSATGTVDIAFNTLE